MFLTKQPNSSSASLPEPYDNFNSNPTTTHTSSRKLSWRNSWSACLRGTTVVPLPTTYPFHETDKSNIRCLQLNQHLIRNSRIPVKGEKCRCGPETSFWCCFTSRSIRRFLLYGRNSWKSSNWAVCWMRFKRFNELRMINSFGVLWYLSVSGRNVDIHDLPRPCTPTCYSIEC